MGTLVGWVIFAAVVVVIAALIDRRNTATLADARAAMRAEQKQHYTEQVTGLEALAVKYDMPELHEELQGIHRSIQEAYSDV